MEALLVGAAADPPVPNTAGTFKEKRNQHLKGFARRAAGRSLSSVRHPTEQPQSVAESGPDPPWGGWGYIGPGPCSFWGERAQPMAIRARKDRRGRPVGGLFPLLGLTLCSLALLAGRGCSLGRRQHRRSRRIGTNSLMAELCRWRGPRRGAIGWENRHGIVDAPMPDDGPELLDGNSHRQRQPQTDPGHPDYRSVSLLRAGAHVGAR